MSREEIIYSSKSSSDLISKKYILSSFKEDDEDDFDINSNNDNDL